MTIGDGPRLWKDCKEFGRYFRDLHVDTSWIRRRVETIDMVDSAHIQRRISLDVDMNDVRSRALKFGVDIEHGVFLPISLLKKNLLLDFDIRDDSGNTLSILTSDEDSHAAQSCMLASIENLGVDPGSLNTAIIDRIYHLAREEPSSADCVTLADSESDSESSSSVEAWTILEPQLNLDKEDVNQWNSFFSDDEFRGFAIDFTLKYCPIVRVDCNRNSSVIKIKLLDTESAIRDNPAWREEFCITESLYEVPFPSAGRAQREHFRIIAPEGILMLGTLMLRADDATSEKSHPVPRKTSSLFTHRVSTNRVSLYTRNVPVGNYAALVALKPDNAGFAIPAILSVGLSAILLLMGSIAQFLGDTLEYVAEKQSSPAVSLILIIPSTVSAYLARQGDHEIRARLLRVPRFLVGISAISTAIAIIATVGNITPDWMALVWLVCAIICMVVLVLLVLMAHDTKKQAGYVRLFSDKSQEDIILNM